MIIEPQQAVRAVAQSLRSLRLVQVLVAEDDRLERTILRAMVLRLGHTCVGAADGNVALRLFIESKPDVVISDWLMPGLQGPEFCLRARAVAAGRPLYFILQTVLAQRENVLRASRVGVDAYLIKPVRLEELTLRLAAAEAALNMQRAVAAGEPAPVAPLPPSPPPVEGLNIIDLDQLNDFRNADGGASDLLLELVQIFREDTPAYLEAMRIAILRGDAKELRQNAHTLEGSTSAIGAVQMYAISLKMEDLADHGEVTKAKVQLVELSLSFDRTVEMLERFTRTILSHAPD